MNKNVILYPVNDNNIPIIQHIGMIKANVEITCIAISEEYINSQGDVPRWVSDEKLLYNLLDTKDHIDIWHRFKNNLISDEAKRDIVIAPLSESQCIDKIIEDLKFAINAGRNIYSMHHFDSYILSQLKSLCKKNNVDFWDLSVSNSILLNEFNLDSEHIYPIDIPIIVIAGVSSVCSIIDLQLKIRQRFLSKGYSVCQIGSFNFAESFGIHMFPQFMHEFEYTNVEKILFFNRFIKELSLKDSPDVIIISIADALLRYNDIHTNGFGVLPYLISQAVLSDYNIIALGYGEYPDEQIMEMKECLKYRFHFTPDALIMSNILSDISGIDGTDTIRYFMFDVTQIDQAISATKNTTIYNALKSSDIDVLFSNMIQELESNVI